MKGESPEDVALLSYWQGLCYNRTQVFDKAIEALEKALPLEGKYPDLEYEYGQALYASQKLKPAREAFKKSAYHGYKPGASQYYVGFLSQILEDYTTAMEFYRLIQTQSGDPDKVKQAALLQIAEIELTLAGLDRDPNRRFRRYRGRVTLALKKVIQFDETSPLAQQAKEKLLSVQNKLDADSIPRFKNGVPIATQPWVVKLSEVFSYDSNVLTRADQSLIAVSNQGSSTTRTEIFGKYEWIVRQWSISPELDVNYSQFTNRTEPLVFQNDNMTLDTVMKTRLEHIYDGKPAAFSADLAYNITIRDWTQTNRLFWYSRFYSLTLGERLQFFSFGSTLANANLKLFSNADDNQNAIIPAATVTQNFNLGQNAGISLSFTYDSNIARNPINDRRDYRSFVSLNLPEFTSQTDLSLSLSYTVVDTVNQSPTRGTETMINPSISLTRTFIKGFSGTLNYSYTNNISLDLQNYGYSRHVLGLNALYQL